METKVSESPPREESIERSGRERSILSRPWWWTVSAGALALVLGLGLLAALWYLARPLSLLLLGVTIAMALSPAVDWLEQRIPRILAILSVYAALLLLLAGLSAIITPGLVAQAQGFTERVPDLVDSLEQWFEQRGWLGDQSILDTLSSQLGNLGSSLVSLPLAVLSSLFDIFILVFISLYWLIQLPAMMDFTLSIFPQRSRGRVRQILRDIGQGMGGYIRGTAINGLIVGFLTYLGLLIIGVDYPLVLGLLAGLLELIPVIGPVIAAGLIFGLTILQSLTTGLIVLGFMVVMQQLENNILVPRIMQSQTAASPLLVIFALFAGNAVGGLLGAIVAIPLLAGLRVFILQVFAPQLRKWTGAEEQMESNIEGSEDGTDHG